MPHSLIQSGGLSHHSHEACLHLGRHLLTQLQLGRYFLLYTHTTCAQLSGFPDPCPATSFFYSDPTVMACEFILCKVFLRRKKNQLFRKGIKRSIVSACGCCSCTSEDVCIKLNIS